MKRLIIIGAGGFGREVLAWARDCEQSGCDWKVGGFLDDNLSALDKYSVDVPVLGRIQDFQLQANDVFVCAIGSPAERRKRTSQLRDSGATFVNVIHPTVVIGQRVQLGVGVIVCPYTVLTTDIQVGDHTAINIRCSIGHDAKIGSYCQLSSFCDVTGGVTLEDEVLMGSHATVLPGVRVEKGSTVGAGSVAIVRVRSGTTVMGVPAKPL